MNLNCVAPPLVIENPSTDLVSYTSAPLVTISRMTSVVFGATLQTPIMIQARNVATMSSPAILTRFTLVLAPFTNLAKVLDDEEEVSLKIEEAVRFFLRVRCVYSFTCKTPH
jgi:hypothetical protein